MKARAEDKLAKVQGALAVTEEVRRKVEAEVTFLEVERTSILLEVGVTKDELSSFQSQAGKDKAAMEEDYQKVLEPIFAYGYGSYMFKHNICGDQAKVPNDIPDYSDPLPPEFFTNPRYPPTPTATEATSAEVDQS